MPYIHDLDLKVFSGERVGIVGAAAYGSAFVAIKFGLPWWTLPLMGSGFGLLFGIIIALPALRLDGFYYALLTLGVVELCRVYVIQSRDLGSATGGLYGAPSYVPDGLSQEGRLLFSYYASLAVLLATLVVYRFVDGKRLGRVLRMAPEKKEAFAQACGVDYLRARITVFLVSSTALGAIGGFYATHFGGASPNLFSFDTLLLSLAMLVIGGIGRSEGAVLGTAIVVFIDRVVIDLGPLRYVMIGTVKRHVLVDTQGLLMHAVVHAADMQDRDGGVLVMATLFGLHPFLLKLYADGDYQRPVFQAGVRRVSGPRRWSSGAKPLRFQPDVARSLLSPRLQDITVIVPQRSPDRHFGCLKPWRFLQKNNLFFTHPHTLCTPTPRNDRNEALMCGIVGLFIKDRALEPELGRLLSGMLSTMCDRGPDSAGFAVYGTPREGVAKITVQCASADTVFPGLEKAVGAAIGADVTVHRKSTHAVIDVPADKVEAVRAELQAHHPEVRVMGAGDTIEIYKEVGYPTDVAKRFELDGMQGTHGIGHTRMATESAVTTLGAHPFSTGADQCLVHNGSLSNHNNLRREMTREGVRFETQNDSEVAAAYLTHQMNKGLDLGQALNRSLQDLDGFYTFVVGTRHGFGVLRDPIACKPAVLAETDQYVAFGSEYRALVALPGIESAHVWEPEPAMVYLWER